MGSGRGPVMATTWLGSGQHCEFHPRRSDATHRMLHWLNTGNGATDDRNAADTHTHMGSITKPYAVELVETV